MNLPVVMLALGGVLFAVAWLPWMRRQRVPLTASGLFFGGLGGVVLGAPHAWGWLKEFLAFPLFVIEHWPELDDATRVKVVLLWSGYVGGGVGLAVLFYKIVWRAFFPDLVLVDERGRMTRYGRAYSWDEAGVSFRYDAHWTPPWRMENLETTEEPVRVGAFKLGVRGARFDAVAPFEWRAVPVGAPDAFMPTTRVRLEDYMQWETRDLERKESLAKKGAQGHLFTQREKLRTTKTDFTVLRSGHIAARRPKEHTRSIKPHAPSAFDRAMQATRSRPVVADVDQPSQNGAGGE